jgi:hypothetical protein
VVAGGHGEMSGIYRQCESKQWLREMSEVKRSDIMTYLQKPYVMNMLHFHIANM